MVSPHWAAFEPGTGHIGAYVWEHPPDLIPPPAVPSRLPAAARRETLPLPRPAQASEPAVEVVPIETKVAPYAGPAAGMNGPGAVSASAGGAGEAATSPAKIEAVAFPLERAPDDPGTQKPQGKGLWQRLTQ